MARCDLRDAVCNDLLRGAALSAHLFAFLEHEAARSVEHELGGLIERVVFGRFDQRNTFPSEHLQVLGRVPGRVVLDQDAARARSQCAAPRHQNLLGEHRHGESVAGNAVIYQHFWTLVPGYRADQDDTLALHVERSKVGSLPPLCVAARGLQIIAVGERFVQEEKARVRGQEKHAFASEYATRDGISLLIIVRQHLACVTRQL